MTHIIVEIAEDGSLPETLPRQADGSSFPFALELGATLVFSDSRTDLVGLIIDGYDTIEETADGDLEALIARSSFASRYADSLQQMLVAQAVDDGRLSLNEASQTVLEALFNSRATHTYQSKSGEWNGPVPLVVSAHLYMPYQDSPPVPKGDVLVIDGFTETTFLDSLSAAGLISLNVFLDGDAEE